MGKSETRMPITAHLEELRYRLIVSLVAVAVGVVVSLIFVEPILGWLTRPAAGHRLQALHPTEVFVTYMRVSLYAGLALALPVILYQFFRFVSPGLYPHERRGLLLFLPFAVLLFLLGVLFAYFVLVPAAMRFLLSLGSDLVEVQPALNEYISFTVRLLFWVGVAFETPLLIFLLVKLRVIEYARLRRMRRYAVLLAFVVAAAITPTPDPLNQTLVALPIWVLYELGLLLSRFA